jgi:hypothetical protein
MFLVPPSLSRSDPAEAIQADAKGAGITVLVPFAPGEMPRSAFSDGFHLNADGAADSPSVSRMLYRRHLNGPGCFPPRPTSATRFGSCGSRSRWSD